MPYVLKPLTVAIKFSETHSKSCSDIIIEVRGAGLVAYIMNNEDW